MVDKMSFSECLASFDAEAAHEQIIQTNESSVLRVLMKDSISYCDFLALLSPSAERHLDAMAMRAQALTRTQFGKNIMLYIPLYLSNECENSCAYCGFKRENNIVRHTLSVNEIHEELQRVYSFGMRSVLLLTGESSRNTDIFYLERAVRIARKYVPLVSLEVYPLSEDEYRRLADAGASGITVYQEAYHEETYQAMHPRGRKRDYVWRLNTPDRALAAGMRKIGIGTLLGLNDFRYEAACVGYHAQYLMKRYWKSEVSISFPRLRPSASGFQPVMPVSDKNMAQMIFALRIFQPTPGLTISTRESATFRNNIIAYGITMMSAGSRTNPGGYGQTETTARQFETEDGRSVGEVAEVIRMKGYYPVFKDWDDNFGTSKKVV